MTKTCKTVELIKAENAVDMFKQQFRRKIPLQSVKLHREKLCTGMKKTHADDIANRIKQLKTSTL